MESMESARFDSSCPHCNGPHDIAEIFDGGSERCRSCGALLQGASSADGTFWLWIEKDPPRAPPTGRERTRAQWRKRGRR